MTWLSRIHIGRYQETDKWEQSVTAMGINWLNHTPRMKVTDHNRLVFMDMVKGNYTSKTIQHWQEAGLLLGLIEASKAKENQKIEQEIQKYLNIKLNGAGEWREK